ncbi:hypothetical protein [Nitriliruptor alkaliphilus]|uniref:hypothetical protein n=1 Tax=Nitriliruptor alkaliphilus TaxID=427918 RepID=UPI0006984F3E|nr:hypothetical protein [Nitriliruptor alkaliphilus]
MSTLVVMGSGETTPTMVTTHQRVLAGVPAGPRLVIDTPYGFQENADELTARTLAYLAHNVGYPAESLTLRRAADLSPVAEEALLAQVREAAWVYAGPGSPTYLARQWLATGLPAALRHRLTTGGEHALVFASAAAVTLGAHAVPVYEIYKAGEEPRWEPGLDLFGAVDLDVAVIAHYDNQEGGTHDTRYCYLGASRLRTMEALLPTDTWVLGVDEHTALVVDLVTGRVRIEGRGGVTVRAGGAETVFPAGGDTTVDALLAAATGAVAAAPDPGPAPARGRDEAAHDDRTAGSPLLEEVATAARAFDAALASHAPLAAAEVTVALEGTVRDWSTDVLQSDELDRARAELRRQVVGLARLADAGLHEHRELVAPLVELLLDLRTAARADGRFVEADRVRDALLAAAVEVRDGPDGTTWVYADPLEAGP